VEQLMKKAMKTGLEIQKNVMAEFRRSPILNTSEIRVAVINGIVALSGTVDTYTKKMEAEKAAKRVIGVEEVTEDIEVKVPSNKRRNDTEITQAIVNAFIIVNALKWQSAIPEDRIKIKVENAWVTLDGYVEWDYQRNSAKHAIENLQGIIGITNNIKVKPSLTPSEVKENIIQRSASLDAERVKVIVDGTKVILKGKVRSYAERKDAELAAWLAPGVEKVENELEIDSVVFSL
jgi:osmotically-inducible protein OsmY